MTTTFIQRVPTLGLGDLIAPDRAMDAGTLGLIDTIKQWPWPNGVAPTSGATIAANAVIKNFAPIADGVRYDPAVIPEATTYAGGGVVLNTQTKRVQMPSLFCPRAGQTARAWLWWYSHTPPPGITDQSGFSTFFYSYSGSTPQVISLPSYNTDGTLRQVEVGVVGRTSNFILPPVVINALSDGLPHQHGLEVLRSSGQVNCLYYLDGVLVFETGWVTQNADWSNPQSGDVMGLGRYPGFNAWGVYGKFWRAITQDLSVAGALPMVDFVARDYMLNSARITAASVA